MSSKNRIRFFRTIGFRITLWYSVSVLIILLLASSFLYYRLHSKLNKKNDSMILDEGGDLLQSIMAEDFTLDNLRLAIEQKSYDKRYYKLSVRLLDIEKNTFITSTNFFAPNSQVFTKSIVKAKNGEEVLETVRVEGRKYPYRLLTKPVYHDGSIKYVLQVGFYLKSTYKEIKHFYENMRMLIPALIVFSIVGGWLIAKKSLSPIQNINKTTRKITATNLNTRLNPTYTGDELEELTNTINHMLDGLEDSFKKIVQFTSDVSHELRTPIAALKIGTEVVLAKERTAEVYRDLHESNLKELDNATRMINDLLVLLRSDSGVGSLYLKTFSIGVMLKELQNTFRLISEAKKINLSINGILDIQIKGDEKLLRRVFSNLLDNAIKYTLPGGDIILSLDDRGDRVVVCVKDTGIGIQEDQHEKVFGRFFCVDPSRSKETGGIGLGLSICKNIVELHQGGIEIKSRIGTGSTFIVTLPKSNT